MQASAKCAYLTYLKKQTLAIGVEGNVMQSNTEKATNGQMGRHTM